MSPNKFNFDINKQNIINIEDGSTSLTTPFVHKNATEINIISANILGKSGIIDSLDTYEYNGAKYVLVARKNNLSIINQLIVGISQNGQRCSIRGIYGAEDLSDVENSSFYISGIKSGDYFNIIGINNSFDRFYVSGVVERFPYNALYSSQSSSRSSESSLSSSSVSSKSSLSSRSSSRSSLSSASSSSSSRSSSSISSSRSSMSSSSKSSNSSESSSMSSSSATCRIGVGFDVIGETLIVY